MTPDFQLRGRNTSDLVRSAAPGIQLRPGRTCEVVCATGVRSPATVKLANPEDSGKVFNLDLRSAVPLGEYSLAMGRKPSEMDPSEGAAPTVYVQQPRFCVNLGQA